LDDIIEFRRQHPKLCTSDAIAMPDPILQRDRSLSSSRQQKIQTEEISAKELPIAPPKGYCNGKNQSICVHCMI
jgi:hypothetical protein